VPLLATPLLATALLLTAALLSATLRELLRCLLRALADTLDGLPGALSDLAQRLVRALPEALDGLARALSDLADRLAGSLAQLTHALTRTLADVLNRAPGALADVLNRIARVFEGVAGAGAHIPHGTPDARQQLRVPVKRQRNAVQNRADVVQPGLQQSLCLDALDLELDLAEPDIGPDADLHHLADGRHDGYLRLQVLELEVDLVDLDDRDVDQDVWAVADLAGIAKGVVVVFLSLRSRPALLAIRPP
jgi:hypothetical protein